jgi:hypothetical protein
VEPIRGRSIWASELSLPSVIVEDEPWMSAAACRSADPEVFFPETGTYAKALEICAGCSVLQRCRAWGDRAEATGMGSRGGGALFGVVGGETPRERAERRRAARRPHAKLEAKSR